jgi:hypothetical protein
MIKNSKKILFSIFGLTFVDFSFIAQWLCYQKPFIKSKILFCSFSTFFGFQLLKSKRKLIFTLDATDLGSIVYTNQSSCLSFE